MIVILPCSVNLKLAFYEMAQACLARFADACPVPGRRVSDRVGLPCLMPVSISALSVRIWHG